MNAQSFVFEGTPEQKEYAAEMVHNRLRAETRLTNGKAALWYMGGVGILLALIGLGVGLVFWGYARYADVSGTADKLADTLKTVLEKVTVQTTGEIKLADGSRVKLDTDGEAVGLKPGGTVRLEPGGTVRMDGGSVRVDPGPAHGNGGSPLVSTAPAAPMGPTASAAPTSSARPANPSAPTTPQMQGSAPYAADSDGKLVVEFTRFANRPFANGQVTTGWKFHDNTEDRPYTQYCYYRPSGAFSDTIIDLAVDGRMIANDGVSPIDRNAAAQECRWFDGSSTQAMATPPGSTSPATPTPFAPSTMSQPPAGAKYSDSQNWCRSTYPATIQDWCLKTFTPENVRKAQPIKVTPPTPASAPQPQQTVPVVNERLRMDPVQRKAL